MKFKEFQRLTKEQQRRYFESCKKKVVKRCNA